MTPPLAPFAQIDGYAYPRGTLEAWERHLGHKRQGREGEEKTIGTGFDPDLHCSICRYADKTPADVDEAARIVHAAMERAQAATELKAPCGTGVVVPFEWIRDEVARAISRARAGK